MADSKFEDLPTTVSNTGNPDDIFCGQFPGGNSFQTDRQHMLPGNGHEWEIYAQATAPPSPTTKTLWIDTSS